MIARVSTVAFQGIEAVPVDVQAQFVSGQVNFLVVGLPALSRAIRSHCSRRNHHVLFWR